MRDTGKCRATNGNPLHHQHLSFQASTTASCLIAQLSYQERPSSPSTTQRLDAAAAMSSQYAPPGHQSDVDVVAWHPNSHFIATGSSDRTVRLWDVAMGSCCRLMGAQTSCLTSLAFSPDGRQLVAGTEDGSIAVYDLGSARRWGFGGEALFCKF